MSRLATRGAIVIALLAAMARGPLVVGAWAEDSVPGAAAIGASAGNPAGREPEWGLDADLLERLALQAETYREYALRFYCTERVRVARYDSAGEASQESTRSYAYLLEREIDGNTLREVREKIREKGGKTSLGGEVKEETRFPPAYAWVFLFSRFNQPYFMYRNLRTRFEGFDWVHEIEFRGALPFTDGSDIRQWEGIVLVDAITHAPLEVHAEPTAQKERIRAAFDRWVRAFNLMGFHLAPRPFGYRCSVALRLRKDGLRFPTEQRTGVFRAVSPQQREPWEASVRAYEDYRFIRVETKDTPLGPTSP